MPESPQLRRERIAGVVAAALVCLALPSVILLVYDVPGEAAVRRESLYWLVGSAAVGAAVSLLYHAPFRALGFVAIAAVGWLTVVVYGVITGHWPGWANGLPLGLAIGALVRGRRGPEPTEETTGLFFAALLGVGAAYAVMTRGRPFDVSGYFLLLVALALVWWSWTRLFRPLFELACEPLLWLMYRIRARGPGVADFPRTGPCLVLANHACWFDPLFLAKILPRPVTPMMTARFYDLPVIRRLMVMFGVIRVPEKALKHDAPEVLEAVAALDRGECVLVFPEGYLRRSEDRPLRRFGQGVTQILKARPGTPVFACWIEGAWGSYTSYSGGPPTKNKRRDFRRSIDIGLSAAVAVPAELMAEHMPARLHLMNLVSAARVHVGLEPLPPFELPPKGAAGGEEPADGPA